MKIKYKRVLMFMLTLFLVLGLLPVQTYASSKKSAVKKVTLSKTQYVLKKGKKLKLKATLAPKKAKGKVTWKSSNKKVAIVNSKGVVTAKASKGKAVITAKAGKKKAVCKITAGTPVKKITASNLTLTEGTSANISAKITPKKATVKKLTYKSSNSAVAKVDKKGKVTAVKAGTAKITILAIDCSKVKKVINVTVKGRQNGNTGSTPGTTPKPDTKPDPKPDTPKFSISLDQKEITMTLGETHKPVVSFSPESEVDNKGIIWSTSDDKVVPIKSADGTFTALTPGTATITATSEQDSNVTASMKVTVFEEGVEYKEAATGDELSGILASLAEDPGNASTQIVTLDTQEKQVTIPEGNYENVTLIVNAPNASIENSARFKHVLIREIAKDTWCEKSGNHIFLDSTEGHLVVDSKGNPNVYLLDNTESITIENNGNLNELLIASAAKVVVKGDSVASPVNCEYYNGNGGIGRITTYVPLDIYSTTTYNLEVGPGGEQTAVRAGTENGVPEISGLGTISITIDSTGEHRDVIAENTGDLEGVPKTTIRGRIRKSIPSDGAGDTDEVVNATVYLVPYSVKISNDNISAYLDGSRTKNTRTDDAGNYSFGNASVGNYVIVVEAEGYGLITQNIYVAANYDGNRDYEVEDIILMEENGKVGSISGFLSDAATGERISKGLTVILRKGMNNITSNEVARVTSAGDGTYSFKDITPGQYTIQIREESDEPEYVSAYENVSVLAEAAVTRNIILTKSLDSNEVRFVLTWDAEGENVSEDLDIHLYGPDPFRNSEYGIYFSSQNTYYDFHLMNGKYVYSFANLDVDDKAYEGPETITVKALTTGQYKVFVQDYTNGGAGNQLYTSNPVIKIYKGNKLTDTVKMPNKEGGTWFVGSYNNATGKFTVADEVHNTKPNTSVRAKIGTVLNQLTQFEVIDASAFAKDQNLINEAAEKYLAKNTTSEQLTDYLDKLQALLEKLQNGLIMEQIKIKGAVRETYGYFEENHDLYSIGGPDKKLQEADFEVVMKDTDTSYRLEKIVDDNYDENGYYNSDYRLVLQNTALGVSTNYYFDYYQADAEYWVEDIQDPGNPGWREAVHWETQGYTGGMNPGLGRDLKITLADGIQLVSTEYAEDAQEGTWDYGERVDLVLHLKKEATGETRQYLVNYKPLGAELIRITDTTNRIISQGSTYDPSWYEEDYTDTYRVFGENKNMGTSWVPEVSEGASCTKSDPAEEGPETVLTVTNPNGAKQVYDIYYYEDTSDAEIIGIYDPANMYTRYYEDTSSTLSGEYYTIQLRGMNSGLGKNLQIHTRAGADAKVEYETGSESWDYMSSDAKITVTAENGKERIYYIVYEKEGGVCNIRSICSNANTLKKVYLYSSYYNDNDHVIHITGSEESLGEDGSLTIKTNSGYTASYSSQGDDYSDGKITVTETATGEETVYSVQYTQDISGLRLRDVTSDQGKIYSVDISDSLSTASQTGEKYYAVDILGETAECPSDLKAVVPDGAKAEVSYADDNWAYSSEYAAKIVVSKGTYKIMYLLSYKQDDSGTIVKGFTDDQNTDLKVSVSNYSSRQYLKALESGTDESAYEDVYFIYVAGNNKELGSTYKLDIPKGSTSSTIHKGESGWRYQDESEERGYYENNHYISYTYDYEDRVVVKAANGAERIYVVAYAQHENGAVVKAITDKENTYVHTDISNYATPLGLQKEEGDSSESSEKVYIIYVKGSNKELGNSYQLELPQGGKITKTVHKGDAEWKYTDEYDWNGYTDESGNYVSDAYYYTDRVTVQAANGAERIYVIAYVQDESGTVVSGISDEKNAYVYTKVSDDTKNLYFLTEEGTSGTSYEEAYIIYVKGSNEALGSSYKLELPEAGKVTKTIHKGDAEWKYSDEVTGHYYYDESGNYVSDDYYYTDRVTVQAANGAERIYVIAYVQDESGTVVSGISDEANAYVHTEVSNYTTSLSVQSEEGASGISSEDAYIIYVKGSNKELGSSYKLELPEAGKVTKTIHKGDAEWKYTDEYDWNGYTDESGNYVSDAYYYTDRVTVQAANGAERIYVIAYVQDESKAAEDSGNTETGASAQDGSEAAVNSISNEAASVQDEGETVVNGISDEKNVYVHTQISGATTALGLQPEDEGNEESSEEVYIIYVKGNDKELGSSYKLELPEGSSVVETIHKQDEGWNYTSECIEHSYTNEAKEYVSENYYYTDRVIVQTADGTEHIFVIAYAAAETE